MKFVKLITCNDVLEANIIKGHLENEDIQCYIANENISNLLPSMNNMFGSGPKIMVAESDFERAIELIDNHFNNEDDTFENEL